MVVTFIWEKILTDLPITGDRGTLKNEIIRIKDQREKPVDN